MSGALACLLGLAAGAAGRDVPVYREYSQPIRFYAEDESFRAAIPPATPDLQAVQAMRDAKARETMMGKETLLELAFPRGVSPFEESSRKPVAAVPMDGAGQEVRRNSDGKGKNWLVQSLALPALGQKSDNAAVASMSAGTKDSQWGWLADDVADKAKRQSAGGSEDLPGEDYDSVFPQDATLNDGAAPFDAERTDAVKSEETERRSGFPKAPMAADANTDRQSLDRTAGGNAMFRDLPTSQPDASAATAKRFQTAFPGTEMSHTREMLSDLAPTPPPDFSALRESLTAPPAPSAPSSGGDSMRSWTENAKTDWSASYGQGNFGGRSSSDFGSTGPDSPQATMWQGRWGAKNASYGLSTNYERHSVPVVPTPIPSPKVNTSFPTPSSGGYKPVWQ